MSRQREWQLERQTKGLCQCCGQPRGKTRSKVNCQPCHERAQDRRKSRTGKLKAEGLCVWCSKPLDRAGVYCAGCAAKISELNRKRREGAQKVTQGAK